MQSLEGLHRRENSILAAMPAVSYGATKKEKEKEAKEEEEEEEAVGEEEGEVKTWLELAEEEVWYNVAFPTATAGVVIIVNYVI